MIISGDEANRFDAIRLDTFEPANQGCLIEANEETGFLRWKDTQGATHALTLGQSAIKIMKKLPRGR